MSFFVDAGGSKLGKQKYKTGKIFGKKQKIEESGRVLTIAVKLSRANVSD